MHQLFVIYKDNKCRRFDSHLCHIVNLQTFSLVRRRLLHCHCLRKDFIQDTCLDSQCLVFDNRIDRFKHSGNPESCFCRNKYQLRIWHICQNLADSVCVLINSLIILFNGIPFIYCNDNTLSSFVGNPCDLGILFCNTL